MIERAIEAASSISLEFESATYAVWDYCFAEFRDIHQATLLTEGLMQQRYEEIQSGKKFSAVSALRKAVSHFDEFGEKKPHYTRNQKVALYLAEGVRLAPDETARVMRRSVRSAIRLTIEARNISRIHGLPTPA